MTRRRRKGSALHTKLSTDLRDLEVTGRILVYSFVFSNNFFTYHFLTHSCTKTNKMKFCDAGIPTGSVSVECFWELVNMTEDKLKKSDISQSIHYSLRGHSAHHRGFKLLLAHLCYKYLTLILKATSHKHCVLTTFNTISLSEQRRTTQTVRLNL